MVTLSNQRKNYDFENTSGTITITGSLVIKEDNLISDMWGNILDNGKNIGQFNYSEPSVGKVNKNVSNLDEDKIDTVNTLISTIVADIKSQINS